MDRSRGKIRPRSNLVVEHLAQSRDGACTVEIMSRSKNARETAEKGGGKKTDPAVERRPGGKSVFPTAKPCRENGLQGDANLERKEKTSARSGIVAQLPNCDRAERGPEKRIAGKIKGVFRLRKQLEGLDPLQYFSAA